MVYLDPATSPEVQLRAVAPEDLLVTTGQRLGKYLQGLDPTVMLKMHYNILK
jgi:hypothetical protein